MNKARTVLGEATDTLYDMYDAVHNAAAGEDNIAPSDLRSTFMDAVRVLAIHVAEGDGIVSPQEAHAIANIFWLDGGNGTFGPWSSPPAEDHVDAAIRSLASYVRLLPVERIDADGDGLIDNLLCDGTAKILQTVLAADVNQQPEVDRLIDVLARLRTQAGLADITPTAPPPPATAADSLASILRELDALVGLDEVKNEVATLTNLARVFAIRRRMGLPVPDMSFHLAFLGNPGTGKTTVARIIGRLYGALGLLSKGHLVEVDRSGLIASYIGQTEAKVQQVIASAMGGVLFIDEAYALDTGGTNDFGKEAVATLLKAMEDHRSDLVVIAAGYTDRMAGFLDMNPGLRSRMPRDLTFANYSPREMVDIFRTMATAASYGLPSDADSVLGEIFQRWDRTGPSFANARDVRNAFERVVDAQANRLAGIAAPSEADLCTLTAEDLSAAASG